MAVEKEKNRFSRIFRRNAIFQQKNGLVPQLNCWIFFIFFSVSDAYCSVKLIFACYVGRPLLVQRLLQDIFDRILQLSGKIPGPDRDFFMTETERRACLAYLLDQGKKSGNSGIRTTAFQDCIHYLKLRKKVTVPYLR